MSLSLRLSVLSKNLRTLDPEAVTESVEMLTEAIETTCIPIGVEVER